MDGAVVKRICSASNTQESCGLLISLLSHSRNFQQFLTTLECKIDDLIGEKGKDLRAKIDIDKYVSTLSRPEGGTVGSLTLEDIKKELEKPGRDPREKLEEFAFSNEVKTLEDVQEGMILPGIVTNITNFGAFVDVGVHTQGLVHVSEMANKFVKDPNSVVSLHQHVTVRVKEVDLKRGRLSLSMKGIK